MFTILIGYAVGMLIGWHARGRAQDAIGALGRRLAPRDVPRRWPSARWWDPRRG
jgi:hypothetical protein